MTLLEDPPTIGVEEIDDICAECGHDWRYHGEASGRSTCFFPVGRAGVDCECSMPPPLRSDR